MAEPAEDKWPAVKAAYDFVLPSYALLLSRFEAADTRLTILLTFAGTITLGAPILAKSLRPTIDFGSPWFALALIAAVLSVGVGLIARVIGNLTLPDPMKMYAESLHESDWNFRKNAIYFAGQHFRSNAEAIRVKGSLATISAALILAEILLFLPWIARAS